MRRQQVAISNRSKVKTSLVVEPWADEFALSPGGCIRIQFQGVEGEMEIELEDSRIVVYGWPGSTYEVVGKDATP